MNEITTHKRMPTRLFAAVIAFSLVVPARAQWSYKEGDPQLDRTPQHLFQPFTQAEWETSNFAPESSLKWFRDAKIGVLVTFGLSARINAEPSWGMCYTRKLPDTGHGPIPEEVWQKYPEELKLDKFNAKEWIQLMRRAGIQYFVPVAKHHDGFHLWDTAESDFKITNTPFGRDALKELADACRAEKMHFGIYYAQREWHHPDYFPVDYHEAIKKGIKLADMTGKAARHVKYLEYNKKAVRELLTKYGQVDVFWWDAVWWGGMFTPDMWDSESLTRMVRQLQPHILQNNRASLPGDFDTPEQRIGYFQDWRTWESCVPLGGSWGSSLKPPKPLSELISMIVKTSCCDGNLLLGFGPQWDGSFSEAYKQRLLEMGDWLKENGSAIYGTRGGPWKFAKWGGSTRRGKTVFLHITDCPGETLRIPALPQRRVESARLLNDRPVEFRQSANELEIVVPLALRKPEVTIVELTLDQTVDGVEAIASGPTGRFDALSYGQVISDKATVSASSQEQKNGGDPQTLVSATPPAEFAFQTAAEARPWIQFDLGFDRAVTAVRLFDVIGQENVLSVSVSSDGATWTTAGEAKVRESMAGEAEVKEPVLDILLNRFEAGAWIPGIKARHVRVELVCPKPASLRLRQVEIWGKDSQTSLSADE